MWPVFITHINFLCCTNNKSNEKQKLLFHIRGRNNIVFDSRERYFKCLCHGHKQTNIDTHKDVPECSSDMSTCPIQCRYPQEIKRDQGCTRHWRCSVLWGVWKIRAETRLFCLGEVLWPVLCGSVYGKKEQGKRIRTQDQDSWRQDCEKEKEGKRKETWNGGKTRRDNKCKW